MRYVTFNTVLMLGDDTRQDQRGPGPARRPGHKGVVAAPREDTIEVIVSGSHLRRRAVDPPAWSRSIAPWRSAGRSRRHSGNKCRA
jgi:hypothetical protein